MRPEHDHDSQHIHITHNFDACLMDLLKSFSHSFTHQFNQLKEIIMTTRIENAENARALAAQVNKAKGEILAKISLLEAAQQASGDITAEEEAAMGELKTAVQGVDDIEPDAQPV